MSAPPKPRWFQFSLRSLILLTTVCCLPLAWVAYERNRVQRREQLLVDLEKIGGYAEFDEARPYRPRWMQPFLGRYTPGEVVGMNFITDDINDTTFASLSAFTKLESVAVTDSSISDAGLAHLAGLTELKSLGLESTHVTDAGLVHLPRWPKLRLLWLGRNRLSDAGLAHVAGLTQLESLSLNNTRITDAGLVHLSQLANLTSLDLSRTWVTDDGLAHLAGLQSLTILNLENTAVTDAGLVQLAGLPKLSELHLGGTKVTSKRSRDFELALPIVRIYGVTDDAVDPGDLPKTKLP